jgi:arylsulfatase A-like enzyme
VSSSVSESTRPNVVWIVLDACRAQNLSCYGYERPTSPNIDLIAQGGVLFEQHFAQANMTIPSVASYMTGRYFAVSCLSEVNWREAFRIPPPQEQLMPAVACQNGYYTVLVSGHPNFLENCRLAEAFERAIVLKPKRPDLGYATLERLTEKVLSLLRNTPREPFFLYLHATDTHFPHFPTSPYDRWLPEGAENQEHLAELQRGLPRSGSAPPFSTYDKAYLQGLHDGSIRYADVQVGRIVDCLRRRELFDNTLLVLGADHGDALGEDGVTIQHAFPGVTQDEVLRVPFILSGAGLPEGRRIASLTENVDIVPTLVDLLDLETTADFHGESLVPIMTDPGGQSGQQQVFAVAGWQNQGAECRFDYVLADERFKYELASDSGEQHLWSVPDLLGRRTDVLTREPEAARAKRDRIHGQFAGLYEARMRLPFRAPDRRFAVPLPEVAHPRCTYETMLFCRWLHILPQKAGEESASVSFCLEVPDGEYDVSLEASRGSAFRFAVEEEPALKVVSDDKGTPAKGRVLLPFGAYTVSDGTFEFAIDRAAANRPAAACYVHFSPRIGDSGAEASGEEQLEQQERLRALGYFD